MVVPSLPSWLSRRSSHVSGCGRAPRVEPKPGPIAAGFARPQQAAGPSASKRPQSNCRRTTPRRLSDALRKNIRRGTTAVELAFVLPVLLAVYFSLIEFGHAYLASQLIKTAARQAGRLGVSEGRTTDQVITEANRVLGSMMDATKATIYVKDAKVFDDDGEAPTDYQALTDVEVNDLEARHLFLVRIEVPYNAISLFPNGFWHTYVHNLTLTGQAAMRHE
jgi:hypothetical protein